MHMHYWEVSEGFFVLFSLRGGFCFYSALKDTTSGLGLTIDKFCADDGGKTHLEKMVYFFQF